jgi:hypothetical protein
MTGIIHGAVSKNRARWRIKALWRVDSHALYTSGHDVGRSLVFAETRATSIESIVLRAM